MSVLGYEIYTKISSLTMASGTRGNVKTCMTTTTQNTFKQNDLEKL